MTWWGEMAAQFVGGLLAGAILLPIAIWAEATLDERMRLRQNRHDARKKHD